jgi:hypothetical protein
MHKLEKTITIKTNVTHKPLDENIICLHKIIDQLLATLLPIFSNFLQGNFHLSEKLMLLENRHQNRQIHTSNFKRS